uniref:Ovule protein n=1 Tax=Acrobeloides nanus TaxID=290746 RepID=A0A914EDW4_9BILA
MFLGIPDSRLSIILNLGFSWIPFVNSFTTIYFVRPYKNGAKKLFCFKCFKVSHQWQEVHSTSFFKSSI